MHVIEERLEKTEDPFLLSELYDFDWDKVCFLYVEDSSHRSLTIKEFINIKGFQYGHWTQKLPFISIMNLSSGGASNFATGLYAHEYGTALIFVKNNVVKKVIKPHLAKSGYDFDPRKWRNVDCPQDIKIEFGISSFSTEVFQNLYITHP